MITNRICVGILFGGRSEEHSVSIKSARTVINALRRGDNSRRFDVAPFYIDREGCWWPPLIGEKVLKEIPYNLGKKKIGFSSLPTGSELIDIWFPILHGPNGEDGTVQGLLTLMGKPYVGSTVLGSALGMDKIAMKAAFAASGLSQLPYIGIELEDFSEVSRKNKLLEKIEEKLGYPCFVKPANLGSSIGISKAENCKQLLEGISTAAKFDSRIVIEKGVRARELECAVLGSSKPKTSVVGEIKFSSDWYDYETKYNDGNSQIKIPAEISKETTKKIQDQSLKAFKAISAKGMARVDFFYEESTDSIWINEINTLPGFTSQSMYPRLWEETGLTIEKLTSQLLDTARQ